MEATTLSRKSAETQILNVLKDLNQTSKSIEASAVMTRDGFSVAALLSKEVDPDRLGAMSASLLSLAQKAAEDLERGSLEQVLIHGSTGFIVMVQVGTKWVLSVVSRTESKLGMLLLETRKAAKEIGSVLMG